jgi:hypothetical protein
VAHELVARQQEESGLVSVKNIVEKIMSGREDHFTDQISSTPVGPGVDVNAKDKLRLTRSVNELRRAGLLTSEEAMRINERIVG